MRKLKEKEKTKKVVSWNAKKSLLKPLQAYAKHWGRSMSQVINDAVDIHLRNNPSFQEKK